MFRTCPQQRTRRLHFSTLSIALALLCAICAVQSVQGQKLDNDRRRGVEMLNAIKKDIQKNYYDANFRGLDLDAHFKAAEEKIKNSASFGEALAIIARTLMVFDDSHTFFIAPAPEKRLEQGWSVQMMGDKCYVVAVKPGSDADAKGLKPGDEIISLADNQPTRKNLWMLMYFLRNQLSIPVVVRRAGAEPQAMSIMAKFAQGRPISHVNVLSGSDWPDIIRDYEDEMHFRRHRLVELENVVIWKMPAFNLSEGQIDDVIGKARKRQTLIIDLRGNGGGYEKTLLRVIGNLLDHDVKIADIKSREKSEPLIAKTRGANHTFSGKLVVLVDSESGSAAELLARVVQLEKRGVVMGDRTSGMVMRAIAPTHESTGDRDFYYGVSVTIADLVMTDGKSLEGIGVKPDELGYPTQEAMASQLDPVLSRAVELVGSHLDPKAAGALFPIEWRQ